MLNPEDVAYLGNDTRFQREGLLSLYGEAGSVSLDDLMAVALRRWPDCMEGQDKPPILVRKACGRAILREDGRYERPVWSIMGYRLDEIFIMEDGTAYPG